LRIAWGYLGFEIGGLFDYNLSTRNSCRDARKEIRMKRHALFILGILVFISVGCGSDKELTEASGRRLLATKTQEDAYRIDIDWIRPLFAKSRTDYKTFNGEGPGAVFKKLIEHGWVAQSVETHDFPDVSGVFVGTGSGNGRVFDMKYDVHPDENAYSFGGTASWKWSPRTEPSITEGTSAGPFVAVLKSDGSFDAHFTNVYGNWVGKYTEDGAAAYIDMPEGGFTQQYHLVGKSTGKRFNVNWYQYEWTPEGRKHLAIGSFGVTAGFGGKFKIGELSELRLDSDTQAVAVFTWEVTLDEFGQVLVGSKTAQGKGTVQFGKKPDGTWFPTGNSYE
jgi:hypothetical protein